MSITREAVFEDMFYPADKKELSDLISCYLNKSSLPYDIKPKALIVPHAGYIYSGIVAASGYAYLKKFSNDFKKVIIIGPSHSVTFTGAALTSSDYWNTPLGKVEIDKDINSKLLEIEGVKVLEQGHSQEHSIEVQVPFLQKTLDNFKIVPISVSMNSETIISSIIEKFWDDDEVVFIISSDLSHYHKYEEAKKIDLTTANLIESMQYESLTGEYSCGFYGIRGLLRFTRKKNIDPIRLSLKNSADTQGDKSQVVGYGCWIFNKKGKTDYIINHHSKDLVDIARKSIINGIEQGKPINVDYLKMPLILKQNGACFVTLEKNENLRGCIGSIIAHRSLAQDIAKNAFSSAFEDPRFSPVLEHELADLTISLSILTLPIKMDFSSEEDLLKQLKPNIDGLIISDRGYKAVYLPSVWEQLPDKVDFLQSLKQKAGLPKNHWSKDFMAYRFFTHYIKDKF
ncbi:MAG: AmmeMemoRadiSam system protein B [Candidatus Gastranaerophilales bacterium]|nr:AmmeMemoRadiSam system protein B [Candidatus Gastranaerophilales bacterium]